MNHASTLVSYSIRIVAHLHSLSSAAPSTVKRDHGARVPLLPRRALPLHRAERGGACAAVCAQQLLGSKACALAGVGLWLGGALHDASDVFE